MTIRWTEEELEAWKRDRRLGEFADACQAIADLKAPKPHKYRAQPTVVDGIRFDSKLEARYYQRLQALQAAGQIRGFLRQVPFHLPGRTRLVVDFQVFEDDGTSWFADTKGIETETFRLKLRQARELYPWAEILIVRRGDF